MAHSRRSILREWTRATRQKARGFPLYYTEWNCSSNCRYEPQDERYAAAYAVKIPVVVTARARVAFDTREYSMPPETIGQPATLHLYREHVEILTKAGQAIRHPGRLAHGQTSILPEHRAAMLEAVKELAATEGIVTSPEGGATLAALKRLLADGLLAGYETVVLFLTASGYKYMEVLETLDSNRRH